MLAIWKQSLSISMLTTIRSDDFEARSPDELSLRKGDRIELIERDDDFGDGWYLGKHIQHGKTGLFPEGEISTCTDQVTWLTLGKCTQQPHQRPSKSPQPPWPPLRKSWLVLQAVFIQLVHHNRTGKSKEWQHQLCKAHQSL